MSQQPTPKQTKPDLRIQPPTNTKNTNTAPYSQEAEESVLGAVLINTDSFIRVSRIIKPSDFFFLRNAYIWQVMSELYESSMVIDQVTVIDGLRRIGKLEDVGGAAYLTHLIANTPTSVHAEVYARLVLRTSLRRQIIVMSDEQKTLATDETLATEQIMAESMGKLEQLIIELRQTENETTMELVQRHVDQVEAAYSMPSGQMMSVSSGIKSLDTLLDGFHRRKVYVVGGRKHNGKTGLMTTITTGACRSRARVGFFNVADGNETDVLNNILSQLTEIAPYRLETGQISSQEYDRYMQAAAEVANWKVAIRSKKGMSPREMWLEAKTIQQTMGLDLLVIDYLQRMSAGEGNPVMHQPEREQLNYISQQLTKMAEMLNIPIIVGAQINRASTHGKDKRPTSENLKGSGNLEEDADVVMLVHRPGYYDKNCSEPDVTEIIVDKNKVTRQLGTIKCRTSQISARFMDK